MLDSSNLTTTEAAVLGGFLGSMMVGLMLFVLCFYILMVIADWKIFVKAGEKGWKSLIPIYNIYIMFKIVKMKTWFWYLITINILAAIMFAFDNTNPYTMTGEEFASLSFSTHPTTLVAIIFTSVVELICSIIFAYRLAKVFGKGSLFAVGLFFLPNIFWLILAFGGAKYDRKRIKA